MYSKSVQQRFVYFGMKLSHDGANELWRDGFDESL